MPLQLGIPSTKLNILLISFGFFLIFSNEGSSQSRSMAPRPPGYPLELAGPLVDLQFSSLSEVTHETPGVFSSLLVVRACMLAVQWSRLP